MSRNVSYGSYVDKITDHLKKCGYNSGEIDALMNREDVRVYVNEEYRKYTSEDVNSIISGGHSPNAVANCLDMLY